MTKQEFLAMSLPYGVKILSGDNVSEISAIGNQQYQILGRGFQYGWDGDIYDCKPILHPLSDLTKEIEHKGEKFIPIIELAKLEGLIPSDSMKMTVDGDIVLRLLIDSNNRRALTPVSFYFDHIESVFKLQDTTWHSMQVRSQRILQRCILEWHFDIAYLISKGEAVDVNTLEVNPYK